MPLTTPIPSSQITNRDSVEVGNLKPLSPDQSRKVDQDHRQHAELAKQVMMDVPRALKTFDFANHTYSYKGKKLFKLIKGEFEDLYDTVTCDNHFGGLEDIYYDYLKGQKTKQALVIVTYISCGCGSCDGGSSLLFAFDMRHHKPHLFWYYETGSRAYGEGLKSITFQNHKLVTEQFGICSDKEEEIISNCRSKYYAKNIIRQSFVFNGSTF